MALSAVIGAGAACPEVSRNCCQKANDCPSRCEQKATGNRQQATGNRQLATSRFRMIPALSVQSRRAFKDAAGQLSLVTHSRGMRQIRKSLDGPRQQRNARSWLLDRGHGILDTGYWIGYWIQKGCDGCFRSVWLPGIPGDSLFPNQRPSVRSLTAERSLR